MFELFTEIGRGDSIGDVVDLKVDQLVDFSEEIFKPYEGGRMDEMVESIRSYGIITPIIVRELDDQYEILSGHNRVRAARVLGLDKVPVLVRDRLSDDEARFIVTESNIIQRGFMELSLVERAYCIAVRHEAMKHQGIRSDLVESVEVVGEDLEEVDTGHALAESFDLSPRNVRRYVRIHALTDGMKKLIDQEQVGVTAGVTLSYLDEEEQEVIAGVGLEYGVNISIRDAQALRELSEAGGINEGNTVKLLVNLEDPEEVRIRLDSELIEKYFDGYSVEEIHKVLEMALDMYFARESQEVSLV